MIDLILPSPAPISTPRTLLHSSFLAKSAVIAFYSSIELNITPSGQSYCEGINGITCPLSVGSGIKQ